MVIVEQKKLRRNSPHLLTGWFFVVECFGHGEVVDVLQARQDRAAAKRFFKRLLRNNGREPRKIMTDKLRSYGVAHRELMPETVHSTEQYENSRAEQSQGLPRFMGMRRLE